MIVSTGQPTRESTMTAATLFRSGKFVSGLFGRDDPTFIACVLIALLSIHYSPRGIDYFPSAEMCMIYGYALLGTAIATILLRPRSLFAVSALILAVFLSVHTFASVFLSLGIFRPFAIWLWDSVPTGYLLLFRAFLSFTRFVGISYWIAEVLFHISITGFVFYICTQAFIRTSIRISAATFLITYLPSFSVLYVAAAAIGPDIQFAQPMALFMMLQTALYWGLIPAMSKRFPSLAQKGIA